MKNLFNQNKMRRISPKILFIFAFFYYTLSEANAKSSYYLQSQSDQNNIQRIIASRDKSLVVNKEKSKSKIIDKIKVFKNKNQKNIKLFDLEDLIKSNSEELKIMSSRIEEARFLLKSEVSSWYPNLNLSSTGFPQYISGNTDNELSTNTSTSQSQMNITATLKWDLINPSRLPKIEAARDNFENAKLAYSIKFLDLLLEARSQFFKLQKSIQDIRIAKDSLNTSKISLKEAIIKLKSGLGSKFELLEAKTQLSKDKQILIEKLGLKKITERKFVKLLNLNPKVKPIIDTFPKVIGLWNTSLEDSIASGYKYRDELNQLLLKISINNNQANEVLAKNRPTISLYNTINGFLANGEASVSSPRSANKIRSYSNSVGLQFQWPLFDGGYSKSRYLAKKEKSKEIEAEFLLKKAQIRNEIEEAFIQMNVAKDNITNSNEAIKSAKESLRLSLLRLEAGLTTQREVFNNKKDLTQAEFNHVKAITEYNENFISLQRKTGINEFKKCSIKESINDRLKNNDTGVSLRFSEDPCIELY